MSTIYKRRGGGGGGSATISGVPTVINVKDAAYGAKGDGSTDDTTGVQSAISVAHAAGGGTVYFPPGTYIVSGLTLYERIILRGAGGWRVSVLQLKAGANTAVVKSDQFDTLSAAGTSNAGIYAYEICDLSVDGNKANQTVAAPGIAIYGYDGRLHDFEVFNCKGIGVVHQWGDTAAVSSSSLATGNMRCSWTNFQIHRNDGGGIDWRGPSDSQFSHGELGNNGPSNNTTIGIRIRGNGTATMWSQVHVWGNCHTDCWSLESGAMLNGCEGEGAYNSQVCLRVGGNIIIGGKYFNDGAPDPVAGIQVGDSSASLFSADNTVRGVKFSGCGLKFSKDGGNSSYDVDVWWPDAAQTVVTGTQSSANPNWIDVKVRGGAALGSAATSAISQNYAFKSDLGGLYPIGAQPAGIIAASMESAIINTSLTPLTSGTPRIVGVCTLKAGIPCTGMEVMSGTAAASGITHSWHAITDLNGIVLAVSADDTTATLAASTPKTMTWVTPYTPTVTQQVILITCWVGTTLPSLAGTFVLAGISKLTPIQSGNTTNTGQTTPPALGATLGVTGVTSSTQLVWSALNG